MNRVSFVSLINCGIEWIAGDSTWLEIKIESMICKCQWNGVDCGHQFTASADYLGSSKFCLLLFSLFSFFSSFNSPSSSSSIFPSFATQLWGPACRVEPVVAACQIWCGVFIPIFFFIVVVDLEKNQKIIWKKKKEKSWGGRHGVDPATLGWGAAYWNK